MSRAAEFPFLRSPVARETIETAFRTGKVRDADGAEHRLDASLHREECELLHGVLSRSDARRTLEVGCANGISTMTICDAVAGREGARHTAVDNTQSTYWKGVGRANAARCGFDFFDLVEEDSAYALPRMAASGERIDFALIDGWHSFDHALMDFFYINRMLRVGGLVAFDDASARSVNKVVRYVAAYPAYRVETTLERRNWSVGRRLGHLARAALRPAANLVPARAAAVLLDGGLRSYDGRRDNSSLVVFRKTAEDKRDFWWCPHF